MPIEDEQMTVAEFRKTLANLARISWDNQDIYAVKVMHTLLVEQYAKALGADCESDQ